jgi:peptidoglycan hydrolase-like protein with peptidoglycan-binding domain
MALLISTGDSDRSATACDVSVRLDQYKINKLKGLGCQTVGRYLSNTEGATTLIDKQMTLDEFNLISTSGMSVFPIMQEWNHREQDMTYANGKYQGEKASKKVKELGFPSGAVVYFAVDLDLMQYQAETLAVDFFNGVNDGIKQGSSNGGSYIIPGIYSSRNTCDIIVSKGLAHSSFISDMSTGFSGNLGFALPSSWAYDQIQEVTIDAGLSTEFQVDRNVMRTGLAPSYKYTNTDDKSNADTWAFLQDVQREADKEYPNNRQDANLEVATYMRCAIYNDVKWVLVLLTPCESHSEFIGKINTYVIEGIITNPKTKLITTESGAIYAPILHDKVSGLDLDFPHLFAAMCGYIMKGEVRQYDDLTIPTRSDFVGWAGDLTTFAFDYANREDKDKGMHEREFVDKYFGGNEYRFPAEDLIQDFDAINIASKALNNNMRLSDAVISYYASTTNSYRWNNAIKERFGGNENIFSTFRKSLNPNLNDDTFYWIIEYVNIINEQRKEKNVPDVGVKSTIADLTSRKLIKIANGEVNIYE